MTTNNPTFTTPTTLLQAVNELMAAAKLATLSSLESASVNPNASDALRALSAASRTIQIEGWHFNTDQDWEWQPNQDQEIAIPANVVLFTLNERHRYMDCVERKRKLYNRKEHTFKFDAAVMVDTTSLFDFEECPEYIRRLVTATAGLEFVTEKAPSTPSSRFTASVLEKARVEAEGQNAKSHGMSLAGTSPHFRMHREK